MTLIPFRDKLGRIRGTYNFVSNLDVRGRPRYTNEGGSMGLLRDKKGNLILLIHYEEFSSCDSARIITEEEAYELCLNRGKQSLIHELHIKPRYPGGNQ